VVILDTEKKRAVWGSMEGGGGKTKRSMVGKTGKRSTEMGEKKRYHRSLEMTLVKRKGAKQGEKGEKKPPKSPGDNIKPRTQPGVVVRGGKKKKDTL